jgi:glutamate-1-semialdehyde 2,1-aminomutase
MNIDNVIFDRANRCIAQGYLTNSKNPRSDVFGVFPTHFKKGKGCWIWDSQDNRYMDLVCALGCNFFGYGNLLIENFVDSDYGGCLGGSTVQEVYAAEAVKSILPWTEKIKFVNSGTEACIAAIRMARVYTGRKVVMSQGYHGWSDEFVSLTPPANGIPEQHAMFELPSNLDEIDPFLLDATAAIIVEPVMLDDSLERIEWLKKLRALCSAHGVVLVYDEIVTGIRYPDYTVARHWNHQPDLILMGKAIGNGHKVALIAGKSDIMDGEYFVSGSYFSHIPSLRAVTVVIELLTKRGHQYDVTTLNEKSKNFMQNFNGLNSDIVKLSGWGNRCNFVGSDLNLALFRQEMIKAKFFTKTTFLTNFEIAENFSEILYISKLILERISEGQINLEGQMPIKPISQRVREIANG